MKLKEFKEFVKNLVKTKCSIFIRSGNQVNVSSVNDSSLIYGEYRNNWKFIIIYS